TSSRQLLPRKGVSARKYLSEVIACPRMMIAVSHRLLAATQVPSRFDDDWFTSARGMTGIASLHDPVPPGGGQVGSDWVIGNAEAPIDVLVVAAGGTPSAAKDVVEFFAREAST